MNEEEFQKTKKALRETREAATQSKESALRYLQDIGMVDENGELTAEYNHKKVA
ncbi:hypothetical protein HRR99_04495 [Agrobacterium vaccinii]|uniref:hypothetical protein n=1 Tax=Agrobacterium TaxID=357 RepID=UPI001E2CBD8B|nr:MULTISPECIES: hypothetical protein [Agrobacterium]UHS56089.1 hypothetical protein HRS00_04325 [Agrobacterium vaccinii]UHS60824.1 hypothetical protein HRR99_04495 [Agrobacterium vaccinii]